MGVWLHIGLHKVSNACLPHAHAQPPFAVDLGEDTHTACVLWASSVCPAVIHPVGFFTHTRKHARTFPHARPSRWIIKGWLTYTCGARQHWMWRAAVGTSEFSSVHNSVFCLCSLLFHWFCLVVVWFFFRKWTFTRWRQRTCPSARPSAYRSSATTTSTPWSPISTSSSPSVTKRLVSQQVSSY